MKQTKHPRSLTMTDEVWNYLKKRGGTASEGLRVVVESDKRLQQSWAEGRIELNMVKSKDKAK